MGAYEKIKEWLSQPDRIAVNSAKKRGALEYIQQLEAELEQTKRERDGLSIMLTSAQSAAETNKRKLDAALADMKAIAEKTGCCHCCAHHPDMNPDGSCDQFDPQNPGECWEWRGTYEKDHTLRAGRADRTGTV